MIAILKNRLEKRWFDKLTMNRKGFFSIICTIPLHNGIQVIGGQKEGLWFCPPYFTSKGNELPLNQASL